MESAKNLELEQILITSTSETYGTAQYVPITEEHPLVGQSPYSASKIGADHIAISYYKSFNMPIKIVRPFNTYGPRMKPNDGRVVSNFIVQALKNENLTLYGDGNQTRSFCFIDDMKDALIKLMDSNLKGPFNIGSNEEISIIELAKLISKKLDKEVMIKFCEELEDEPRSRCPSITKILDELNWSPKTSLNEGLSNTINFYRKILI